MKRLLSIVLTLIIVLSFASCGERNDGWYTEGEITLTKAEVESIVNAEYVAPKNVILIIGDGMGPNDIALAEKHIDGVYDFGLVLNQIKNHGLCTTHCANNEITDSAAAGTALATGTKTNRGYIGKW